jgi:hypothetical protein
VAVVKEAAQAIGDMKCIVFFPIFPVIFVAAYAVLWVYGALYFASVREAIPGSAVPDTLRYYNLGFEVCSEMFPRYLEYKTLLTSNVPNDNFDVLNATT